MLSPFSQMGMVLRALLTRKRGLGKALPLETGTSRTGSRFMYHNMLGFVPLRVFTAAAPDGFILSIFSQQSGLYAHHLTHYARRSGEASMEDPEALARHVLEHLLDSLDDFYHPDDPRDRFWHRNPEIAAGDVLRLFRQAS